MMLWNVLATALLSNAAVSGPDCQALARMAEQLREYTAVSWRNPRILGWMVDDSAFVPIFGKPFDQLSAGEGKDAAKDVDKCFRKKELAANYWFGTNYSQLLAVAGRGPIPELVELRRLRAEWTAARAAIPDGDTVKLRRTLNASSYRMLARFPLADSARVAVALGVHEPWYVKRPAGVVAATRRGQPDSDGWIRDIGAPPMRNLQYSRTGPGIENLVAGSVYARFGGSRATDQYERGKESELIGLATWPIAACDKIELAILVDKIPGGKLDMTRLVVLHSDMIRGMAAGMQSAGCDSTPAIPIRIFLGYNEPVEIARASSEFDDSPGGPRPRRLRITRCPSPAASQLGPTFKLECDY